MDEQSGLEYLRWYEDWRKQKDEAAFFIDQPTRAESPQESQQCQTH